MSLLLSAVVLSLSLAAAPAEVAPGATLHGALGLAEDASARYGLNGAPPGPRGAVPKAPLLPGEHHLLRYAEDGSVQDWIRFRVAGDTTQTATLTLAVDRSPPVIEVVATDVVQRDGIAYAGRAPGLRVEARDRSGLATPAVLFVDGVAVQDPEAPPLPGEDREVGITARAVDALGNAGESAPLRLTLDRSPPTLTAARDAPRDGVPTGVVGPGEGIVLRLADAGSGLARLELDGATNVLSGALEQVVTLPMPANPRYRLADALGNLAEATLPLRLDAEPPTLLLVSDGVAQPARDGARLPRSERLELVAEDPLSGVARACAELSTWYGECRPLPLTLIGIDPGRYRVVFRAADRLGHRTRERFEIEVLP